MLKSLRNIVGAIALFSLAPGAYAQMHLQVDDTSYELAARAMKDGNYTSASQLFRRAIKGNLRGKRLVSAYNNLCAIAYSEGAYEQAEKACDEAILADRTDWRAYANRSLVRTARGKLALAQADRSQVEELAPEKLVKDHVIASIVHHNW